MSLNRQNQLPNPRFRDDDDDVFLSKSGLDPYALVPNRHRANTVPEEGLATLSPADVTVHLSDDGDFFSVKAEVPGVRRENLDVSIGDDGRSLTIRGGAAVSGSASGGSEVQEAEGGATSPGVGRGTSSTTEYTETVTTSSSSEGGRQPAQERWTSRSSFSRTVWLPRAVDPQSVKATLDHGVLTMEIPKLSSQNHRVTVS